MDEPLTYEELSRRIESASEGLSQISHIIEVGASEYITNLALLFGKAGIKDNIPAAWLVYAAFQYAELYFGEISREDWMMIYDRGREIKQIASAHPEIAKVIMERRGVTDMPPEQPEPQKSALDIAMSEELGLDFG